MTEAATTEAPKPVEITLGDKTFSVDPAVAAALTEAKKAAEDAGVATKEVERRLTAQLDEVKKQLKPEPAKPTPTDDVETRLFVDPKGVLKQVRDDAVAAAKTEIKAELQQSEDQKAFWSAFYDAHPELKEDDLVVRAIVSRDFASLKDLNVADAIKKLGESTQKYLLERGVKREKGKKGDVVEGGTEKGAPGQKKGKGEGSPTPTNSLTAVIRARAAARRQAAGGVASQT